MTYDPYPLFKLLRAKHQGTEDDFTAILKINQGSIRHRGVIDGGALFGYFLGKQKVTKKSKATLKVQMEAKRGGV